MQNQVDVPSLCACCRAVPKFMKRIKVRDYKDRNVFGVPLQVIVQRTGQPLPQGIQQAMRYLRNHCLDQVRSPLHLTQEDHLEPFLSTKTLCNLLFGIDYFVKVVWFMGYFANWHTIKQAHLSWWWAEIITPRDLKVFYELRLILISNTVNKWNHSILCHLRYLDVIDQTLRSSPYLRWNVIFGNCLKI